MAIHLYCLLATPAEPPAELLGIAGERVAALTTGRVTAWVGEVPSGPETRSPDVARRHDAVARAALAGGTTPLPARAGQRFPDEASCLGEISRREGEILEVLARVQGCVEMTLAFALSVASGQARVQPAEPSSARDRAMGSGRRYLEELRQRLMVERLMQAESASVVAQVASALGDLPVGQTHLATGTSPARLVISHLIPRESEGQYRSLVESLPMVGRARPVVAGPSAPYSFATLGP